MSDSGILDSDWKVLVVDDDRAAHRLTEISLEEIRFRDRPLIVLHAYSGREAVAMMAQDPGIALVLMDLSMETARAGLDAVQAIRDQQHNSMTRIVMVTGNERRGLENEVIADCDINGYLHKDEVAAGKLFSMVYCALKSYRELCVLAATRDELREAYRQTELLNAERMATERAAAVEVARVKDQFLATMSHEIRTPLNAVIGMAGLLAESELTAEQQDFVHTLRVNSDHLLSLISDVLDFSKIESGNLELEVRGFELRECVEEALDLVAVPAREKGLELIWEVDAGTPEVLAGDVTRLRQVLANLLSNAVKFTAEGEVHLSVSSKPLEDNRHEVFFTVRDTGIGMSKETLGRIFQPFIQADSATTRQYGGTGLGLTITRRLVEMMGGEISVASEPGAGSCFRFAIRAEALNQRRDTQRVFQQPNLAGVRVLCVDDNPTNRRLFQAQLESWGAQTELAATPEEAMVWIARGDHFDIALLDFNMPGIDGLDVAAALRERDASRDSPLPILLLSSSMLSSGQRRLATQLVNAVMVKPVKKAALGVAISRALGVPEMTRRATDRVVQVSTPGSLRILLVEDYPDNVKLALHLLRNLGYPEVAVAGNGLEAIAALERASYDLVLMDAMMPDMDGLTATREICARWPRTQRPIIVAMTANALHGDRERCLEAGMDDYIAKPIRVDNLREVLARYSVRKEP